MVLKQYFFHIIRSTAQCDMKLNFEELFKVFIIAMNINRSHPYIKRDVKWFIQFASIHGLYTILFIFVLQNIALNLKKNNFSEVCKNGTLTVVYIVNTFHYSILLWRQTYLVELIADVKSDFLKSKLLPENEQEFVREYARKGRYVCRQWLFLTVVGTLLFPMKNLVLLIKLWVEGEFYYLPMYDIVYPISFIEDNKNNLLIFIITYILMLGYASYSSTLYAAFVPLGPTLMLHACGQLEVVKSRVDTLFKNGDKDEIKARLKGIILHLQYIYDFVDRTKLCFRLAYEVTLKGTTVIVPITCYEVLESLKHGEVSLEFLVFIIGGALFGSVPCYYGDLLMEKGEDLRLAIYSCGWERLHDRSIRSTLLVMLQRAHRPVAIQSLFRVVCLDALTDVFQQAYTIFNLLNASLN